VYGSVRGFTPLGLIVKRVSGMSPREFTTKSVFEPLGMTYTHLRDDHEEIIKHDALGYEQEGKDKPYRMCLTNFDTESPAPRKDESSRFGLRWTRHSKTIAGR
jgi:CubicO group peptidase (beta-lactamase class C family)